MRCATWETITKCIAQCGWRVSGRSSPATTHQLSSSFQTIRSLHITSGIFPASQLAVYPLDAPIGFVGTHTIFPLSLNRCLVMTNLGYVRNPQIKLTKDRVNARVFGEAIFDLRKIQTGRQIDETYVTTINYVVKQRARRYVAAARKEWLYPEGTCSKTMWNKLGGKFFLMPDPRKVTFHTQTLVGYDDGRAWGTDEYGRRHTRDDDPEVKRLRDIEWNAFQQSKRSWDTTFGELSSASGVPESYELMS